jgi:hypothetical protein
MSYPVLIEPPTTDRTPAEEIALLRSELDLLRQSFSNKVSELKRAHARVEILEDRVEGFKAAKDRAQKSSRIWERAAREGGKQICKELREQHLQDTADLQRTIDETNEENHKLSVSLKESREKVFVLKESLKATQRESATHKRDYEQLYDQHIQLAERFEGTNGEDLIEINDALIQDREQLHRKRLKLEKEVTTLKQQLGKTTQHYTN